LDKPGEKMMSRTKDKAKDAGGNVAVDPGVGSPKKGERFRCAKCGMEVEVTADCRCDQPDMVHFHCCGQELSKV
jgi:hypothetical protein